LRTAVKRLSAVYDPVKNFFSQRHFWEMFLGIPAAGVSGGRAFRLYACEALSARPVFAAILNAMRRKFCGFYPLNNKARRYLLSYIWLL
jgi:hypothetical protein